MSKKKFVISSIIVGVVGVVAGWLTAPKSGRETRGDIAQQADKARDDVERLAEDARKEVAKKTAQLKSRADTSLHKAKRTVKKTAKKAK